MDVGTAALCAGVAIVAGVAKVADGVAAKVGEEVGDSLGRQACVCGGLARVCALAPEGEKSCLGGAPTGCCAAVEGGAAGEGVALAAAAGLAGCCVCWTGG